MSLKPWEIQHKIEHHEKCMWNNQYFRWAWYKRVEVWEKCKSYDKQEMGCQIKVDILDALILLDREGRKVMERDFRSFLEFFFFFCCYVCFLLLFPAPTTKHHIRYKQTSCIVNIKNIRNRQRMCVFQSFYFASLAQDSRRSQEDSRLIVLYRWTKIYSSWCHTFGQKCQIWEARNGCDISSCT